MATIALIACSKAKRNRPTLALELYSSPLFRWSVAYARQRKADYIYVLSAKHGLVSEDHVLKPYNLSLSSLAARERRAWGDSVLAELARRHDLVRDRFLLLAGEDYLVPIRSALRKRIEPLRGLPVGRRLQRLKRKTLTSVERACKLLHQCVRAGRRFRADFDRHELSQSGIYFILERGERGHGGERIVRIGTHTGNSSTLGDRLAEHYQAANKDRSIFRRNIGRALLHRSRDPYLNTWNLDFTARKSRKNGGDRLRVKKQARIESRVSAYLKNQTSFLVLECNSGAAGLRRLERGLIATVAQCKHCAASKHWMGSFSPDEKIRESALWQVLHLKDQPLEASQIRRLFKTRKNRRP